MKATLKTLIFCALILVTGAAFASTPDGETPAEESVCDGESGAAFGLCNAYCEAMDCHCADEPDCEPHASANACNKVGGKFENITGRVPPCEVSEPPVAECACDQIQDWLSGNGTWLQYATNSHLITSCTDDGTNVRLIDGTSGDTAEVTTNVPGFGPFCGLVDVTQEGTVADAVMLDPLAPDAIQACADLLRAAAAQQGVACSP